MVLQDESAHDPCVEPSSQSELACVQPEIAAAAPKLASEPSEEQLAEALNRMSSSSSASFSGSSGSATTSGQFAVHRLLVMSFIVYFGPHFSKVRTQLPGRLQDAAGCMRLFMRHRDQKPVSHCTIALLQRHGPDMNTTSSSWARLAEWI